MSARSLATFRVAGFPVSIHGCSSPELSVWLAELAPFAAPAVPGGLVLEFRVAPHLIETRAASPGSHFKFWRHDLYFAMEAGHALAFVNEGRGAFDAALELLIYRALTMERGLLAHASAGVVDGQGWLMFGPSGAGKSTAARAGGFPRVLADEMVALRPTATGYEAWGTPFWSKGRTLPFDTGSAPLAVLASLAKASVVAVRPLTPDEAVAAFMRCAVMYETSTAARSSVFTSVCDIVNATLPVELTFPKEGPWMPAARSLILGLF